MDKNYMIVPVELKITEDSENDPDFFIVKGYTSIYNNVDLGRDRVLPGFFTEDLAVNGNKRPALWQHDSRQPLGMKTFTDKIKGLHFEAKLPKSDTFVTGRVIPQIRSGSIQGASMGYHTETYKYIEEEDIWDLIKGCLIESSFVTFPMNQRAIILSVSKHLKLIYEKKLKSDNGELGYLQQFADTVGIESYKLKGYTQGHDIKSKLDLKEYPLADIKTSWNKLDAIKNIKANTDSNEKPSKNYKIGFMYYDTDNQDDYKSYKLPYLDYIDNKFVVIPSALSSIVGMFSGKRNGPGMPENDKNVIKEMINKYYVKMGREEPFKKNNITFIDNFDIQNIDKQDKTKIFDENIILSTQAKEYIANLLCEHDRPGKVKEESVYSGLLKELREYKKTIGG